MRTARFTARIRKRSIPMSSAVSRHKKAARAGLLAPAFFLLGACTPFLQNSGSWKEPFLNLDFEQATPTGMPLNWYIEAEEAGTEVRAAIDSGHHFSGQSALRITSATDRPVPVYTPLFLGQDCPHLVVLDGAAYAEGASTAIRPVLFTPGGARAIGEPLVLAGNGWHTFQHRISADPNACLPSGLKMGLLIQGPGEIWIDGLHVLVDGQSWGQGAPPTKPTTNQIRALAAVAIGLENYSVSADPAARLRAAAPFGSARVVALGENTHGADGLFRMKFDLIRFLVRERGYQVLALEAPAIEADKVDDYVLGHSSDRAAAIEALGYPSWKTDEMWRVVEWLRQYNRSGNDPVHFRGFDVQNPQLTASPDMLMAIAKDPAVSAALATLRRTRETDLTGKAMLTQLGALSGQVADSTAIPAPAKQKLRRYLRTLDRGLRMDRPEGKTRDAFMADEVMDLLEESDRKVILWADNTHVTRAGGAMGHFLGDRLGSDYLSVGMTFNRGHYSAYGPERVYPVQEGFPGTHEYLLSQRRGDYLVALASLPAGHPLRQAAGFRYIGSRPQRLNQFQPLRLEEHFDLIGFTETTEGTRDLTRESR